MEKGILNKLGWNLTVPTLYVFLVRFLKAALGDKEVRMRGFLVYFLLHIWFTSLRYSSYSISSDLQMEHMVFFFAELALMQYSMIMFCPSMVAASSVYAAQCTLNKSPLWTATLRQHTGFSEPQLLYVVSWNTILKIVLRKSSHCLLKKQNGSGCCRDCTQILVNSHSVHQRVG